MTEKVIIDLKPALFYSFNLFITQTLLIFIKYKNVCKLTPFFKPYKYLYIPLFNFKSDSLINYI